MKGCGVFPFRDFLVARTYEPRADTTAMLVADALADAVGDVAVLRVEARLGLPVVVQGRATVELTSTRSIVCGVRDVGDVACVAAAGALADALDLQLILAVDGVDVA